MFILPFIVLIMHKNNGTMHNSPKGIEKEKIMDNKFNLKIGCRRSITELNNMNIDKNLSEICCINGNDEITECYERFQEGKLVSQYFPDSETTYLYYYNYNNKVIEIIQQIGDKEETLVTCTYDITGNLKSVRNHKKETLSVITTTESSQEIETKTLDGITIAKTTVEFDSKGNAIYECQRSLNNEGVFVPKFETWYLYDFLGRLIYQKRDNCEKKYKYNFKGKVIAVSLFYPKDSNNFTYSYEYDSFDRLVEETLSDGTYCVYEYTYK